MEFSGRNLRSMPKAVGLISSTTKAWGDIDLDISFMKAEAGWCFETCNLGSESR